VTDANRRPTKAERKEQARLERDELRRRIERRKRNRTIGIALVAVAATVAVVGVITASSGPAADVEAPDALLARAEAAAGEASCEPVRTVEPYGADDQAHVGSGAFPSLPDLSTYPSTPPASGPHDGSGTLPAGVYDSPPPIGLLLHSLEHGGTVVWYDPDAPPEDVRAIRDFYDRSVGEVAAGQDRVIVAPYDYEATAGAGRLPDGARMALVAWHRVRTCADPSLPVALDFTSSLSFPAALGRDYEGEAPEPGAQM